MLVGSFDDFSLPDVLRLLARAEKTGELVVERPQGTGRVFFQDGDIYCLKSDFFTESLVGRLVRTGAITSVQLAQAERRLTASGERLGEALLFLGAVTQKQLEEAFRAQIEASMFELLRREFGQFAWEPEMKTEPEFTLAVGVEELIQSASMRMAHLNAMREVIPSSHSVPAMTATPPEGVAEIALTRDQWRIVALMDGRRSVGEIGRAAEMDDLSVLDALYDLATRGLLGVSSGPSGEPAGALVQAGESSIEALEPSSRDLKPFEIVLLCTGNRVRSPTAEAFLRQQLEGLPVSLMSAGVEDWGRHPPIPRAVEAAAELGVDISSHRARSLGAVDISTADLVIGFERRHLQRATAEGSASAERAFTIVEIIEYLDQIDVPAGLNPVERAREAVARAHDIRVGLGLQGRPVDVVDPLGGPPSAYRSTAARLKQLCARLADGLFGDALDRL